MVSGRTSVATVSVASFSMVFLKMGLGIERFSLGVFTKAVRWWWSVGPMASNFRVLLSVNKNS